MAHLLSIRPFITEKAMHQAQKGKYTFLVSRQATKLGIAQTVGKTYSVTVTGVNITKRPAKQKARGTQQARVKAIVTLKTGQSIKGFDLPQAEPEQAEPETSKQPETNKSEK